jgi:hypothetical protein
MDIEVRNRVLAALHSGGLSRIALDGIDQLYDALKSGQDLPADDPLWTQLWEAIAASEDAFVLAPRLPKFGAAIGPASLDVLNSSRPKGIRSLAALVLLSVDDWTGVPLLIEEVRDQGEFELMAILMLLSRGVREIVPFLVERLRTLEYDDAPIPTTAQDLYATYLRALRRAGGQLTSDLKSRLESPKTPRYLRDVAF